MHMYTCILNLLTDMTHLLEGKVYILFLAILIIYYRNINLRIQINSINVICVDVLQAEHVGGCGVLRQWSLLGPTQAAYMTACGM